MGKMIDDFDRVGNLLGEACDAAASLSPADNEDPKRDGKGSPAAPESDAEGSDVATDVGRAGRALRDPARVLSQAWAEVAGPDVAANARPAQLRRGRLVVTVSSSAWAHALQDMGEDLRERLNERMKRTVVEKIVFRHAGWEDRWVERSGGRRVRRPRETALSEEEAEALAAVRELDLPVEVRDRIARAMKAAFVRGEQDSVR